MREEGNGRHVAHASSTAPERSAELGPGHLPPLKARECQSGQQMESGDIKLNVYIHIYLSSGEQVHLNAKTKWFYQ